LTFNLEFDNRYLSVLIVKPKDIYSNYLLVATMILLILGIGNWIVGAVQVTKYQKMLRNTAKTGLENSYRSFQELDHRKNKEVEESMRGEKNTTWHRSRWIFITSCWEGGGCYFSWV